MQIGRFSLAMAVPEELAKNANISTESIREASGIVTGGENRTTVPAETSGSKMVLSRLSRLSSNSASDGVFRVRVLEEVWRR